MKNNQQYTSKHTKTNEFHIFQAVEIKNAVKVTEEKNGTYAVRTQMFEYALMIFFHNCRYPVTYENK